MSLNNRGFLLSVLGLVLVIAATAIWYGVRASQRIPVAPTYQVTSGDVGRGREALIRHGCGACHAIAGVPGARGRVAPSLTDVRERSYLAGRLPNTPGNMIRWIQNPQGFIPGTAMPNLGVTESEARDIAAYLYRHR